MTSLAENHVDPLEVGQTAPDLTLPDDQGQSVQLSDLWAKQPLVLLFVRHFG